MDKSPDNLEKEMLTDCLMELKMSELLRLQRSLERLPELREKEGFESKAINEVNNSGVCVSSKENNKNSSCVSPQALPLTAEKRLELKQNVFYRCFRQPLNIVGILCVLISIDKSSELHY